MALKMGAAVLVTGGFGVEDDVIKLADEMNLPVNLLPYDTFTVVLLLTRLFTRGSQKKML